MHIPENYLSPSTCGVLGAAMVPVWVHAVRTVRQTVPKEKMPLLGVAAAFCFLAMMFNVPVPGGTTGHAVCGTLVAILFGPWAATLCISIALAIQAVFFGDGGILALGANCFNMAFVLPMVGYGVYALVMRAGGLRGRDSSQADGGVLDPAVDTKSATGVSKRELVAAGIGSYLGINAAALCAAIEFGIQPIFFSNAAGQALYCPYPLWVSVPAMLAAHLTVCGAAEVAFTVGILAYVRGVAPGFCLDVVARDAGQGQAFGHPSVLGAASEQATSEQASGQGRIATQTDCHAQAQGQGRAAVAVLLAALMSLVPLGLLASGDAWGEWSTEDVAVSVGYTPAGMSGGWEWHSMLPDYSLGALPDWAGYLLSAVVGVALLVIVFRLIAAGMRTKVDFGTR
ncbi:MAG: cobalt transporter CbiM [Atopobiaceae bacterium]